MRVYAVVHYVAGHSSPLLVHSFVFLTKELAHNTAVALANKALEDMQSFGLGGHHVRSSDPVAIVNTSTEIPTDTFEVLSLILHTDPLQ